MSGLQDHVFTFSLLIKTLDIKGLFKRKFKKKTDETNELKERINRMKYMYLCSKKLKKGTFPPVLTIFFHSKIFFHSALSVADSGVSRIQDELNFSSQWLRRRCTHAARWRQQEVEFLWSCGCLNRYLLRSQLNAWLQIPKQTRRGNITSQQPENKDLIVQPGVSVRAEVRGL